MIGFLSLFVCVIGLVVYCVSASGKAVELGRIAFGVGLWVFLLNTDKIVSFLR